MLKNRLFVSGFVIIALAGFSWGYFSHQQSSLKSGVEELLERTLLENQQLKEGISEAQDKLDQLTLELKQKESMLLTLSNVQALKNALSEAQATISQLSEETERVRQEKAEVEQTYLNTNRSLQGLSAELGRSREELKLVKKSLTDLEKKKDANYQLSEKQKMISQLESEVDRLKSAKILLQDQLSLKDKSIKELSALNQNLKNQISQLPSNSQQQQAQLARQNQEVAALKIELAQSQIKLSALQKQLASRQAGADNSAILRQLDETKRLYESAKLQTSRFYEILATKEIELNNQKREGQVLKQRASELEAKLSGLDAELKTAKPDSRKAREIEAEKLGLESKYLKAQNELEKQNNLIALLSNNLDSLNKKLLQAEDEKKSLEAQISSANLAKATLEEELKSKKKQIDDLNDFYAGLKTQLIQFSGLLTEKEAELAKKEKSTQDLKDAMDFQQSKVGSLQRQLDDTKMRQKKIIDNLSQAANINAELQQKLSGAAITFTEDYAGQEEEKKKAEEAKRKVEVILLPEIDKP